MFKILSRSSDDSDYLEHHVLNDMITLHQHNKREELVNHIIYYIQITIF